MNMLTARQIHLDFHTSELIPDIASEFNPESFAKTAKEAHVSSMTVFARCHHGWLYYPSKKFPELVHPNLKYENLLTEQVKALHKVGIKAPVYITVQWDYQNAQKRPEWLIRRRDGSHEGSPFTAPGFYQSLCVNTGYFDFLKAQTAEVCELLGDELDGLFFDIVGIRPCLCASCRREMAERSVNMADDKEVRKFAKFVMDRFKREMTEFVHSYNKNCTVFYNAGHVGPVTRESASSYTHFELESLPSGTWGYLHFPCTARYAKNFGLDCMGMTGKFHTSWGDFHSYKNLAALEFECFRMLSYGFAASIGDQLEPYGVLNPATYRLIGKVFSQIEEREEWARPSKTLTEAAILTPEGANSSTDRVPATVMGAVQMLEELAIQFDIIDSEMDINRYRLLIIPEDFAADDAFAEKLNSYVKEGGKIIAAGKGAQNEGGEYPESFGAVSRGQRERFPDFLIANGTLADGLEEDAEYVIYNRGEIIEPTSAKTLLYARAPYFSREGTQFCSHRYTPSAKGDTYPAVLGNGSVILFSHPIFNQYRQNAPRWCKLLVSNAIDMLIGERMITHDGPSTMTVSVLDQEDRERTNLHILSYIPVRKSVDMDIIEERTVLKDISVKINIPRKFKSARLVPENIPLEISDNTVKVPEINGYAIIELS